MKARFFCMAVLSALLAAGCAAPAAVEETPPSTVPDTPSPAPTASPTPVQASLALAEETPAPELPTPTPTPEPTPEPDPYVDGMEKTVLRDGFYYVDLNDALKARISGLSYPADPSDCLVSYDDLCYVRIRYINFSGEDCEGELIVAKKLGMDVLEIFAELYDASYPICSVRLVDDYGEVADDNLSMAADNTSSFCYRKVSGSKKLSRHSYGAAIDINPLENPYVKKDGSVSPAAGKAYVDRSKDFDHKIDENDLCYQVFTAHGWEWGGHFKSEKDYQHFSKDIG